MYSYSQVHWRGVHAGRYETSGDVQTSPQTHVSLQVLNWPAKTDITAIVDSVDELIGEAYTRNPATRVEANEMAKRARHEANKDIECFKR